MAFGITAFAESPFSTTGIQNIDVAVTGQGLSVQEGRYLRTSWPALRSRRLRHAAQLQRESGRTDPRGRDY